MQDARPFVHPAHELLTGVRTVLHYVFWLGDVEGVAQQAVAPRPLVLVVEAEIAPHQRRKAVHQPKNRGRIAAEQRAGQAEGIGRAVCQDGERPAIAGAFGFRLVQLIYQEQGKEILCLALNVTGGCFTPQLGVREQLCSADQLIAVFVCLTPFVLARFRVPDPLGRGRLAVTAFSADELGGGGRGDDVAHHRMAFLVVVAGDELTAVRAGAGFDDFGIPLAFFLPAQAQLAGGHGGHAP